jgi:glycosyltransferase involved in cell wall biosynthesis
MPLHLGIGVITYNRQNVLAETLDRIQSHTKYPFTSIAVADDGSTDGTMEMLQARNTPAVGGRNMGIAWNKNRALFLLAELLRSDIVILLEDDAYPNRDSWELEWMNAALRWGHVNLAGEWMREGFVGGAGTLDDPVRSTLVTANCAAFSREALLFGGYFDARFRGYGHEHVEHSGRLVRNGYGGADEASPDGSRRRLFYLIWGGIHLSGAPSHFNQEQVDRNLLLARDLFVDRSYRAPWSNEAEMAQFRDEMRSARPRVL